MIPNTEPNSTFPFPTKPLAEIKYQKVETTNPSDIFTLSKQMLDEEYVLSLSTRADLQKYSEIEENFKFWWFQIFKYSVLKNMESI